MEKHLPEIFLSIVSGLVVVVMALRKVFVMRSECSVYRETCNQLQKKEAELKLKDFQMRDGMATQRELQFKEFQKEVKKGFEDTAAKISCLERMMRILLDKMDIHIDEG